jgi:hypothetical protein
LLPVHRRQRVHIDIAISREHARSFWRLARVRNPLGTGLAVVQDHALEAEADRLGQRAAAAPISPARSVQRSAPTDFRVVKLPGRVRVEALGQDRLAPMGALS